MTDEDRLLAFDERLAAYGSTLTPGFRWMAGQLGRDERIRVMAWLEENPRASFLNELRLRGPSLTPGRAWEEKPRKDRPA